LIAVCLLVSAGAWAQAQLSNPASQRCIAVGGTLRMEMREGGGQFGVCVFAGNRQCEEWAMFRGECPAGGVTVPGEMYAAPRYCLITGGRLDVTGLNCALPGGKTCDVEAYWAGGCGRS
jgi:uncharacterized protein